jgi:hypothetical protein
MRTALLAATLLTASGGAARAQDDVSQESGPVELAPTSTSAEVQAGGAVAAPASAAGKLRVYGGLRIGVGGGFKPVDPSEVTLLLAPATPGIQAGAEYLLMKYFALGVETRFNWARGRDSNDRVMLWDLVLKPRANYQLSSMPVELYAALPFGLSVSNPPNDNLSGKASGTLGLSGGANYFFNGHFGVNAEMGWLWHWMKFEADGGGTATWRLGQWTLVSVNFMYAF